MIESLILHPAILVARGFESLSTSDMRFLNTYRRHFEGAEGLNRTHVYRMEDFELGGILNPFVRYLNIESAYREASRRIDSFPYLTLAEVRLHFYYGGLIKIFEKLMSEIYRDLDRYLKLTKTSLEFYTASHADILQLESTPVYLKISALHRCGLGDKLLNAFDYVFKNYHRSSEVQAY